jgi:hypothetical protein
MPGLSMPFEEIYLQTPLHDNSQIPAGGRHLSMGIAKLTASLPADYGQYPDKGRQIGDVYSNYPSRTISVYPAANTPITATV